MSLAQLAFIGVFVVVLLGIASLPKRLLGHEGLRPPWWRNVRVWAMIICLIQILVYWIMG